MLLCYFQALKTIDNEITKQLSLRRKHREAVGPSYYDPSMYAQGPMGVIPETLRPRPGHHPSYSQQRVYEVDYSTSKDSQFLI